MERLMEGKKKKSFKVKHHCSNRQKALRKGNHTLKLAIKLMTNMTNTGK